MLLQLNLALLRDTAPALQLWGLSATLGRQREDLALLLRAAYSVGEAAPLKLAFG